jgi:hypothetical protein
MNNIYYNDTIKIINLLNKYNINIDKIELTKNKYFMKLYNDMKNNYEEIFQNNIKIQTLNKNSEYYLENNKFTSDNIKNKILKDLKYGYKFTFKNNNIIYFCKKNINNNVKIPNIIIHMYQIIILLKKIFNKTEYEQNIIYFETNEKKKFPKKNIVLGPNEVNSGLTFLDIESNDKNGNIILYRKEEVLKVLIHELIHSNLIDSKIIFSKKTNEFSNLFCVNYKILLNEAFTESLTTIINIFYINIVTNLKKKDLNIMFQNEIKYSNYICNKIMNFYNIENISNILKKNNICINNFPQKTNVFSYYILKNILLTNYILFSEILNKYTHEYKVIDENCIIEIINLIINNISLLDKNRLIIKDNNKSLRLCLYELNK